YRDDGGERREHGESAHGKMERRTRELDGALRRSLHGKGRYHGRLGAVLQRARACLAAIATLVLSSGCAEEAVRLNEGTREYVASDYAGVLRQWTRSAQLTTLDAMDNVLLVTATYESWDFPWAYAIRYSEDYRLTIDQRH